MKMNFGGNLYCARTFMEICLKWCHTICNYEKNYDRLIQKIQDKILNSRVSTIFYVQVVSYDFVICLGLKNSSKSSLCVKDLNLVIPDHLKQTLENLL